jgi:Icc-related predicted phosphoesterase
MRIVAIADTHGHHGLLRVPGGDVLVHAGDMCQRGTMSELVESARWIRSLPHPVKIVVPGNHDWPFVLTPGEARAAFGPSVTVLEDSGVTIDGVKFWGSPWQPEFCGWAYNLPRGPRLAMRWAEIPDGTDVLITHGPPAGTGDRTDRGERVGCADMRDRIEVLRPKLHLFGHIHEDGGAWDVDGTLTVNCTVSYGQRAPTVIEIEGDKARASAPVRSG